MRGQADQTAANDLVADCLRRLQSALPLVSKHLIRPRLEAAIDRGDVTAKNMFPYYASMYEHLRSRSERSAAAAVELRPVHTSFEHGMGVSFPAAERAREAEFEAHGALFAFFSMVEHLLLIEMTFIEFDASTEPFSDFLQFKWSDKFKRVVDLTDRDAKMAYDT